MFKVQILPRELEDLFYFKPSKLYQLITKLLLGLELVQC